MPRDSCLTREEEELRKQIDANPQLQGGPNAPYYHENKQTIRELNDESVKMDVYQRTIPQRMWDLEYKIDQIIERVDTVLNLLNGKNASDK